MSPAQDTKPSSGTNTTAAPAFVGKMGGGRRRNKNRSQRNRMRNNASTSGTGSGVAASGTSSSSSTKFKGACTKSLTGSVIIYSPDSAIMLKQLQTFLPQVEVAAGLVSGTMAKSIRREKAFTMAELVASKNLVIPKDSYTTVDDKGFDVVNTALKDNLEKIQDRRLNKIADDYNKYEGDWERFFATIMGQLCPAMKEELRRSSDWEDVSSRLDPGSLLSLIQTTCLNGNDKDYYPNRFINGLMDLVSNRQGSDSPSEFAERTKTLVHTFNVFMKLKPGSTFAGIFPGMREHAINSSDEFNFDAKDYESQAVAVKHKVQQVCEDIMIGCMMTVFSNESKSDTLIEARRNELAGNLGGYATDSTSAVNILVGNELLKKKGGNPRQSSNSGGGKSTGTGKDTSESLVFVGVAGGARSSGDVCWECGAKDHLRYECPKLSDKQKQVHRDKRDYYKNNRGGNKGDAVDAAVLMHLGNESSSDESENKFWSEDEGSDGDDASTPRSLLFLFNPWITSTSYDIRTGSYIHPFVTYTNISQHTPTLLSSHHCWSWM